MRVFLKRFGFFAAIQLAILAALLWSYNRQYPAAQNFLAASIDKQSLIRTQAAPRLIFIGGSSMAFGVNSARIAEACGRHPVNMGLHAALGLQYMLAEVEPHLRQGDWVIVAPEYQQFVRGAGSSDFLVNMMEIQPSHARFLSLDQWSAVFDRGILRRVGKEVRAVFNRPLRFFRSGTIKHTRAYYRRDGFNSNGDVVAHLNAPRPKMTEKEFHLRRDPSAIRETVGALNHFADMARKKGARVWFSHAPLPEPIFQQNRAAIEDLETTLEKEVRLPRLDRSDDLVFPTDYFFDTWYHLARPGVERRTEFLAARMAEQAKLFAADPRTSR